MTSTYDHRVIQGAESGQFLRRIDELLQGEDGFYESIFGELGIQPDAGPPPGVEERHTDGAGPVTAAEPAPSAVRPGISGQADLALLQAVQAATVGRQGPPHARPPGRAARPARLGPRVRPGARPGHREPHPRADAGDPRERAARGRAGRDVRRRPSAPPGDLLRHRRLRDRAHLRPRAARVAAPVDRVRRVPPAAARRGEARAAPAPDPRSTRSRPTCTRRSSARSSSRSRASTCCCRCSTRRSSWPRRPARARS